MKKVILSVLLVSYAAVISATECENPRNAYDAVYCEQKVYQKADTELNNIYKQLMQSLNAEGKKILRTEQRKWVRGRDAECTQTSQDMGQVISTQCMTQRTVDRTHFLSDRYRECSTTGCMNSRLVP